MIWTAEPVLETETLDEYLKRNNIEHFSAHEITYLRQLKKNVEPPRKDWPNIITTLHLAEALRTALGCPLLVGNGYRPADYNKSVGGAKDSQHIYFRALDLDLPEKAKERRRDLFEEAARLFVTYGRGLKIGLGFYAPHSSNRVHIDAGFRMRTWEKTYVRDVIKEMGLKYP